MVRVVGKVLLTFELGSKGWEERKQGFSILGYSKGIALKRPWDGKEFSVF